MQWKEFCSCVLVGAFWGCTNPLLRKGSASVKQESKSSTNNTNTAESSFLAVVKESLSKFREWRVWIPYALNQCGSLVYYWLLASSDLSMAVPVCNALSLVFSCVTSYMLGERVDQPLKAILGSTLVLVGVPICMSASSEGDLSSEEDDVLKENEVKPEL